MPELVHFIIEELKESGYLNSKKIALKENNKEIRFALGELYAKDLLKTHIVTDNPDDEGKLYRIYYTTQKFRDLHGGIKSEYDC
jgi:hypothetical protein